MTLAANNADVGGGEVMLLSSAEILREQGIEVTVVGPQAEDGVVDQAAARGFAAEALGEDRRTYLRELRRWSAGRRAWLWAHGLVPGLATAGRQRRILHLHQAPARAHRPALAAARLGAATTLVPSVWMTTVVDGTEVLPNWTVAPRVTRTDGEPGITRVGFLGRHSQDKGVDVLARALAQADQAEPGRWRLVLAGDSRFVDSDQVAAVEAALAPISAITDRLGWCNRPEFFAQVDLVVFPSRAAESFGLVAAEAMAARVPLVVTDAGALPEVVGPDYPWVARAGDVDDLQATVTSLARSPSAEVQRITDRGFQRWQSEYSPEAGAANVSALVRRLGILSPSL